MGAPISILGLAASDPTPGLFVQVSTAAGLAAGSGNQRGLILVGNMLSTGSATVDTTIYGPATATTLGSEADAITLFGAGSELHRMYRRILPLNQATSISAIAVTESVGVKAAVTFTVGGTATSSGFVRFWVCGEPVDVSFITGDTGTATFGDAAVTAINARTDFPVVASHTSSSASLVFTAKQKGPRGNDIRVGCQVFTAGAGITCTPGGFANLTGGTTADSNTTALTTIAPHNFYYTVSAAWDATQFGAVSTQVATQAQPVNGNRQRCFAASPDTISNAITVATGLNAARTEYVWLAQSDVPPSEMAAVAAALYALEEANEVPRLNFNAYPVPFNAPLSGAAPSKAQIKSALNNGITPLQVGTDRSVSVARRITSYSLNGATQDYRVRDSGKVTVCDFYADDLSAIVATMIAGKNIADDPPDATTQVPANCVCPRDLKAQANKLTRDYGANGLIDKVGQVIANTVSQRETSPTNRIDMMIPIFVADIANQVGILANQVG